jgi:uncharacterized protein
MAARDRLLMLGSGLVAGLAGGLFGVGGGILLVPMLTGAFALTQHQAHGTSLAVIGATAIAGLAVYAAHGHVAWATALIVGLASALTARAGARLTRRVSAAGLARAFAVFLVLVALRLMWPVPPRPLLALDGVAGLAVDAALGASVGLLAGFMGVGGGVIAVPAFVLLLGMTQQQAQGTSLAVILMTAPVGAIEHHRHGNVALGLVPLMALGAAVGAPLASALAHHLPSAWLGRAFALFLVANAAHTWVRAGRRPAPTPSRA